MSDIADILGLAPKPPTHDDFGLSGEKTKPLPISAGKKVKKPKGMSREVFDLMDKDSMLPPEILTMPVSLGFKSKRVTALQGKWVWEPIVSSARKNNISEMMHWVKAEARLRDYPWTKFNVVHPKIELSDEIYEALPPDSSWTREDTTLLVRLCDEFTLNWSVIRDRIRLSNYHTIEEMKNRYFSVVRASRELGHCSVTNLNKTVESFQFDLEVQRKMDMDNSYFR
jgi:hypothetical protein